MLLLLSIVLFVLKVTGVCAGLSWWVVAAPVAIGAAIWVGIMAGILGVAAKVMK